MVYFEPNTELIINAFQVDFAVPDDLIGGGTLNEGIGFSYNGNTEYFTSDSAVDVIGVQLSVTYSVEVRVLRLLAFSDLSFFDRLHSNS